MPRKSPTQPFIVLSRNAFPPGEALRDDTKMAAKETAWTEVFDKSLKMALLVSSSFLKVYKTVLLRP